MRTKETKAISRMHDFFVCSHLDYQTGEKKVCKACRRSSSCTRRFWYYSAAYRKPVKSGDIVFVALPLIMKLIEFYPSVVQAPVKSLLIGPRQQSGFRSTILFGRIEGRPPR